MLNKREVKKAWDFHYLEYLKKDDEERGSIHDAVAEFGIELVMMEVRPYASQLRMNNQFLNTLLKDPSQKYQRQVIEALIVQNEILIKELEAQNA
jgi:uncharacterized protein YhaN